MKNTEKFTIPAGTYYVGDPCYAFSHGTDSWDKLLTESDFFEGKPVLQFKGDQYVGGFSTMYGDGQYNGFPVDAGLIGFVHESLIEDDSTFRQSPDCGKLVTFDAPWVAYAESDGNIVIGHIHIFTGDNDDLDDDENY